MGAVLVVVPDVLGKDLLEVTAIENEEAVEALSPGCPHEPLGERVPLHLSSRGQPPTGHRTALTAMTLGRFGARIASGPDKAPLT